MATSKRKRQPTATERCDALEHKCDALKRRCDALEQMIHALKPPAHGVTSSIQTQTDIHHTLFEVYDAMVQAMRDEIKQLRLGINNLEEALRSANRDVDAMTKAVPILDGTLQTQSMTPPARKMLRVQLHPDKITNAEAKGICTRAMQILNAPNQPSSW